MRWPWRRHTNGEAAKQAKSAAQDQVRDAEGWASHVDRTTRTARDVAIGTDRFAREIERAMRRGTA